MAHDSSISLILLFVPARLLQKHPHVDVFQVNLLVVQSDGIHDVVNMDVDLEALHRCVLGFSKEFWQDSLLVVAMVDVQKVHIRILDNVHEMDYMVSLELGY